MVIQAKFCDKFVSIHKTFQFKNAYNVRLQAVRPKIVIYK